MKSRALVVAIVAATVPVLCTGTAAVATPAARAVFDVKDYGARGDGSADDTAGGALRVDATGSTQNCASS